MAETDKIVSEDKEDKFWNWERRFFVVLIFIVIIAIWYLLCKYNNNTNSNSPSYDVDALFSAFAFLGMIIALWMQKFELRLQRKQLDLQHTEMVTANGTATKQWMAMKKQQEEMSEQKKLMDLQKFESAIFNMLGQYSNIINGISGKTIRGQIVNGHDYTNDWAEVITNHEAYNYNDDNIKLPMANYVNYLFQIFKYIDQADILNDENLETEYDNRHKYCSIVTSYISYNEMVLLKFCIEHNPNYNDFGNLCWDYALYENLRNVGKAVPDHDDALFKPKAAKERWIRNIKDRLNLGFPPKRSY